MNTPSISAINLCCLKCPYLLVLPPKSKIRQLAEQAGWKLLSATRHPIRAVLPHLAHSVRQGMSALRRACCAGSAHNLMSAFLCAANSVLLALLRLLRSAWGQLLPSPLLDKQPGRRPPIHVLQSVAGALLCLWQFRSGACRPEVSQAFCFGSQSCHGPYRRVIGGA